MAIKSDNTSNYTQINAVDFTLATFAYVRNPDDVALKCDARKKGVAFNEDLAHTNLRGQPPSIL